MTTGLIVALAACSESGGEIESTGTAVPGTPATGDDADSSDSVEASDASDNSDASDTSGGSDSSDDTDASESTDATDPSASDDDSSETTPVTTVDDIRGLDLAGNVPRVTTELPAFAATNSDGSARGPPNITGSPTVLWFFPAAGTYG